MHLQLNREKYEFSSEPNNIILFPKEDNIVGDIYGSSVEPGIRHHIASTPSSRRIAQVQDQCLHQRGFKNWLDWEYNNICCPHRGPTIRQRSIQSPNNTHACWCLPPSTNMVPNRKPYLTLVQQCRQKNSCPSWELPSLPQPWLNLPFLYGSKLHPFCYHFGCRFAGCHSRLMCLPCCDWNKDLSWHDENFGSCPCASTIFGKPLSLCFLFATCLKAQDFWLDGKKLWDLAWSKTKSFSKSGWSKDLCIVPLECKVASSSAQWQSCCLWTALITLMKQNKSRVIIEQFHAFWCMCHHGHCHQLDR